MKMYWRIKAVGQWQILYHPAALLLTLWQKEDGWHLQCLGEELKIGGPGLNLAKVQQLCVEWLGNQLFLMSEELKNGIPSSRHS